MVKSFPSISDNESKILILGTMPGEMSLKLNQYYGHGGNHFWKILFELHDQPFTKDYETRKKLLIKNRIALWDVLKACVREGSSDSAIKEEVPNDFSDFFTRHSAIERIYFNGQKAKYFYDRYVKNYFGKEVIGLPSTSSANTWATYNDKLRLWKAILNS